MKVTARFLVHALFVACFFQSAEEGNVALGGAVLQAIARHALFEVLQLGAVFRQFARFTLCSLGKFDNFGFLPCWYDRGENHTGR